MALISGLIEVEPNNYFRYMELMSGLVEAEPNNFQEVSKHQVWMNAMVEVYSSIMKNSVSSL